MGKVMGRVVTPTGQPAEVHTVALPNGKVNVCYTPQMLGDHMVEIFCGGQIIPGGRFNQKVSISNERSEKKLRRQRPINLRIVGRMTLMFP